MLWQIQTPKAMITKCFDYPRHTFLNKLQKESTSTSDPKCYIL
jgi:hypothetical protein